jgi:DNA-binding LacI/PurR family transcriptional regulator
MDPALIYETHGYEYEAGYAGAKHLLTAARAQPTAIFAFNDQMAIGVLRFALEQSMRVPEDLSIVGVDNVSIGSFVTPRLTTVAQPMADLGRVAAQLLLERIQGLSGGSVQRLLPPELIVRESTGPARVRP